MTLPAQMSERGSLPPIERELPKLSTSLLELVGPLFDELPERLQAQCAPDLVRIAWIAWNAGAPNGAVQDDFAARLGDLIGRAGHGLRIEFDEFIRRRRELFGHDPRLADEPQFARDGSFGFTVGTLDTPELRAWLADPNRPDLRAGLAPSFAEFVREHGLDHRFVELELPAAASSRLPGSASRAVIRWRGEQGEWDVPPLSALFRGDAPAPDAHAMSRYPERYVALFAALDMTILDVAAAERRAPTDAEVIEVYSDIRRGRSGRRPCLLRDALRQRAALQLALRPYSADEFDASIRQLERSVRGHQTDVVSRAYHAFLVAQFTRPGDALRI